MKKLLAGLLIIGITASLIGCGSSTNSSIASDETGTVGDIDNDISAADSELDEPDLYETGTDEEEAFNDGSDDEVFLEPFDTSPTVEETVLWDEQDVIVTATSLEYSNYSAKLNLTFENNSDRTLYFRTGVAAYDRTSVNGYMMSDYLSVEVAAGESEEDSLEFDTDTLMAMGMNEIANITFGFWVEDDDYNDIYLDPVTIETSASSSYDYDNDPYLSAINSGIYSRRTGNTVDYHSEDLIFDKGDISIISETLTTKSADYLDNDTIALLMEIVNNTDYYIYEYLSDIYINDELVCDGFYSSAKINPKTKDIIGLNIGDLVDYASEDEDDTRTLIENGINSVRFTVNIDNENGDEALSPEEITLIFD